MAEPRGAYRVRGPLVELTLARVRELIREPEAVFWVFVFPIVLAAILGLAFRSRPPEALPVAVVAGPQADGAPGRSRAGPDLEAGRAPGEPRRARRSRAAAWSSSSRRTSRPSYAYDPDAAREPRRAPRRGRRAAARGRPRRRLHAAARGGHRAGRALRRLPGARACSA